MPTTDNVYGIVETVVSKGSRKRILIQTHDMYHHDAELLNRLASNETSNN